MLARARPPPPIVVRHLGELASLVLAEAAARDPGTRARGPAAQAARVAAMREVIARRCRESGLTMRTVAAAAGLSERAGYLAFAPANIGFSDLLMSTRLSRANEALTAGYRGKLVDLAFATGFADLSHFNRRFRARFGITPSEARVQSADRARLLPRASIRKSLLRSSWSSGHQVIPTVTKKRATALSSTLSHADYWNFGTSTRHFRSVILALRECLHLSS